jgi:hypothetical protein
VVANRLSADRSLSVLLLKAAGATDIWAQPVAVRVDRTERSASLRRTTAALRELAQQPLSASTAPAMAAVCTAAPSRRPRWTG